MIESSNIAHIVQLAVAPVFLLAGIGAIINVLTSRLGRVVDRARILENVLDNGAEDVAVHRIRNELATLDRRMLLAQRAILLCTLAALFVCMVVATLFLSTLAHVNFAAIISILFVAAMMCIICGLVFFLMEISIATRTLRVRTDLFSKE